MSIEIIALGASVSSLLFAIFVLMSAIKNQKRIDMIEKEHLQGIKRWGINSINKPETGDPMSKTHKTNITTSCPKPPVKSQTKPRTPTHRPMQSSQQSSHVHHHHNDGHTLFDVFADMNDTSLYSSEPSPSYDSGSSYDSFGGGSSDGGGASSDW